MHRILIINESPLKIVYLKTLLQDMYYVDSCCTAREAQAMVRGGGYALILLNFIRSDMDGLTLLERLHAAPSAKDIPIIVMTGTSEAAVQARALKCGAADVVSIPFEAVVLKARIGRCIDAYLAQQRCREEVVKDPLTGIANRRGYEEALPALWNDAVQRKTVISLCMIDIDHFKHYNDTYGHQEGDHVLERVAQTIVREAERCGGMAARYGGEEFIALLKADSAHSAFERGKRLRRAVESLRIPAPDGISPVTVSVGGITFLPANCASHHKCLRIADQMLYQAKDSGRNRVVWCTDTGMQWRDVC